MAKEELHTSFKHGDYNHHLPDATYINLSEETLSQIKTRVEKALKAAKYVAANPDVKEPPLGTYSYIVIGPSADFEYSGLLRKKAA